MLASASASDAPDSCALLDEVEVVIAAFPEVDGTPSNVFVKGRSRHIAIESRPLEAATARLPRFTASSA